MSLGLGLYIGGFFGRPVEQLREMYSEASLRSVVAKLVATMLSRLKVELSTFSDAAHWPSLP